MKYEDYLQHLGTELPNNEQVIAAPNITVTRYVKAGTAKEIEALHVSVQPNDRNPEAIKIADKTEVETEVKTLFQRYDGSKQQPHTIPPLQPY